MNLRDNKVRGIGDRSHEEVRGEGSAPRCQAPPISSPCGDRSGFIQRDRVASVGQESIGGSIAPGGAGICSIRGVVEYTLADEGELVSHLDDAGLLQSLI